MKIYIASSWKNQHAVEMLTDLLRDRGHVVLSFVENNKGETNPKAPYGAVDEKGNPVTIDQWIWSSRGSKAFDYDTDGATKSNLVIYISPSGNDASAEMGAAWAKDVIVFGLWAKGEPLGLMRRMMMQCYENYRDLLKAVDQLQDDYFSK